MEQDPEAKGSGNSYTTEFRQYDPRIARWLSLDPLMKRFPHMSPYVGFDNNPVLFIDPYGLSTGRRKDFDKGGEGEPDINAGSEMYDNAGVTPSSDHSGGTDPDQKKDRSAGIGIRSHSKLDNYKKDRNPNGDWKINRALGNNKRPDLVLVDKEQNKGAIYELKPASYIARKKPLKQVQGYVDQANSQSAYGVDHYSTGTSGGLTELPFKGSLVLYDEKYVYGYFIPNPEDGMIYYVYKKRKQKEDEPDDKITIIPDYRDIMERLDKRMDDVNNNNIRTLPQQEDKPVELDPAAMEKGAEVGTGIIIGIIIWEIVTAPFPVP